MDEVRKNPEARRLWATVYPSLTPSQPGLLGAVTARSEAQVIRLALIYALLDQSTEIRAEHLMAGLAVWNYAASSAAYVFGDSLGDPDADEILRALWARPGGMTRTDIRELFGRHRSSAPTSRALTRLVEGGLAKGEMEGTTGRPAERWRAGELRDGSMPTTPLEVARKLRASRRTAPS
jgi:hypothetical protein